MSTVMNFYYGTGLVVPRKERVLSVLPSGNFTYEQHEWQEWYDNDPKVVRKNLVAVNPAPTESGSWFAHDFAPTRIACIDFDKVALEQIDQRIVHKLGGDIKRKLTTSVSRKGVHAYIETDRVCHNKPEWSAVTHYLADMLGGDPACGGMLRFEVAVAKTLSAGDVALMIEEDDLNISQFEAVGATDVTAGTISKAEDWASLVAALITYNCKGVDGEVGTRGVVLLSTVWEKTPRGFYCVPSISKFIYKQQFLEESGGKGRALRPYEEDDAKVLEERFLPEDVEKITTILSVAREVDKTFGFTPMMFFSLLERREGIEVPEDAADKEYIRITPQE